MADANLELEQARADTAIHMFILSFSSILTPFKRHYKVSFLKAHSDHITFVTLIA